MATKSTKMKLEIEGDKEFQDILSAAKKQVKKYQESIKSLSEEYKNAQNSQEALGKKLEKLSEMQEAYSCVVEATKKGLQNAQNEVKKYDDLVESVKKSLEDAKAEQEELNTENAIGAKRQLELSEEIVRYQEGLEQAIRNQKTAKTGAREWEKALADAEIGISRTKRQVLEFSGYLNEAENSTDHCATSIDAYGKRAKEAAEDQGEFGKKAEETKSAIVSLSEALEKDGVFKNIDRMQEAIQECVNAAAKLEPVMLKLSAVAGAEAGSMDTIRESILKLSNETGQAMGTLSEAVYTAMNTGMDSAEAVNFVATATKLAAGGFTENAAAVEILTTALDAYGKGSESAGRMADYLMTTQNLGKTTVKELAENLGDVIPAAAESNVGMENLSSAMAILTSRGTGTADSASFLKAMLEELGDSGSEVSKLLERKTGLSFENLMRRGDSLGDVMEILGKAVGNNRKDFQELWSSSEAGAGALELLSVGSLEYNRILREMEKSVGATEAAYAEMTDTTESAQARMTNAFENLKIAVGSELQDQMKAVYDQGADLLVWATEFVQENEWLVPVLEAVATGLGVFAAGIAGISIVTKAIIPLWKGFTAAISTNPFGMTALAIAGVAAAITALISCFSNGKSEWEEQTEEVKKQTEAWKEQAETLRDATTAYQDQKEKTKADIESIRNLVGSLKELTSVEGRNEDEKKRLAELTDQLNEKIPNLGLKYDSLADSINMTTKEINTYLEAMEREKEYEDAVADYARVYEEKCEAMTVLAEAQEKMAEAEERSKAIKDEMNKSPWKNFLPEMESALYELDSYTEQVSNLQAAIAAADEELAAMTETINLHTIETARMTEEQRNEIQGNLEAAKELKDNIPAYREEIERITQTALKYDQCAVAARENAESVIEDLQVLEQKYQESYQAAYDNIQGQIGLFEEMKEGSSISVEKMIDNLKTQSEYMDRYADNMKLAMEYGVNKGLLEQLSDGSVESAAILEEIVNKGQDKIDELNAEFERVSEGKDKFAEAMAEMEAYYQEDLDALVKATEKAVTEMAQYDDAYASAKAVCDGIVEGIDANSKIVIEKYRELAQAAMEAYNKEMQIASPSKKFKWSAQMQMEGIQEGVEENKGKVLHSYDEIVSEGRRLYRQGLEENQIRMVALGVAEKRSLAVQNRYQQAAGNAARAEPVQHTTTQNFHIYQPVKTPSELMRAARLEQQFGLAGDR